MRKTVGLLIPTVLLAGCDLLLGPADVPSVTVGAGWTASPVVAGGEEILGLDLAADASGGLVASYLVGGDQLRLSRLETGTWSHVDGPAVTGTTGSGFTRLAVGPSGQAAVLYPSDADVYTVLAEPDFGTPVALSTVTAALRDTVKPRPATWNHVNGDIAYGPDGILRVAVGEGLGTPGLLSLWLFRYDGDWDLGIVGSSQQINGAVRLLAFSGAVEHLVFEAGSQGRYVWWRPGEGWQSRLALPNTQGQPFQIALRADGSSVLGTRESNSVRVAVENYNPTLDQYRWESVEAAEHSYLNWANTDLILDDQGLPGVMYVVGPLPNQVFQVWFAKMRTDGSFDISLVAGNLTLPTFSPFNVRMVRDSAGKVHALLTTGVATGGSGSTTVWEYRLMHYSSEDMGSR